MSLSHHSSLTQSNHHKVMGLLGKNIRYLIMLTYCSIVSPVEQIMIMLYYH